jgi:hypothetical protein
MTVFALVHHLTSTGIQSGKKRRGAVAQIVVGITFPIAKTHRESRLTAFKDLTMPFFDHIQNQRVCGGIEVEANDIPNLFP